LLLKANRRDAPGVVADRRSVGDRSRGEQHRRQRPRLPEGAERVLAARRIDVHRARKGEEAEHHQRAYDRHHQFLHRHDRGVPVQRDRHHERSHQRVCHAVRDVAVRCAQEAVPGGDDRVTARPDRHRREAQRDGQRQARPDEPAADAEERAAGHRHVGTGSWADESGGQHGERADGGADRHRRDGLPERQAEQDGERAEHDVRPGEVGAQEHGAEVARPRVAGVLGEVLDACGSGN